MKNIEEKLSRFDTDIMQDVESKRQELLNSVIAEYNEKYDKTETKYITESYYLIQDSLKKIDKEKNEILSKAIMESRKRVLNKRAESIQRIFDLAKEKLRDFTKEERYFESLIKTIEEGIVAMENGELEIILNYSDEQYVEPLKEKFACNVRLEDRSIDMLGGCKLINLSRGLFMDASYANKLEQQRESFLKTCNIQVEA